MNLALLIVAYEVERDDTPMAKGPLAMLDYGFVQDLRSRGFAVRSRKVQPSAFSSKEARVASLTREIAKRVSIAVDNGRLPVILSGGCLAALGVVTGLRRPGRRASVLWIDAHGDFNTLQSSPSGYWDGMALGAVCGRSLDEIRELAEAVVIPGQRVAHIGGRNLDPPEVEAFRRHGVLLLRPKTLARGDASNLAERLLHQVGRSRDLYLHVDVDGIDPFDAPAVAFPELAGVRLDDLKRCLADLSPPAAVTFSATSFAAVGPAKARRTVGACAELLERALLG